MTKEERQVVKDWNSIMYHLDRAWEAWDNYGKSAYASGLIVSRLPSKLQKMIAGLHPKTTFTKALPLLHAAVMGMGGYKMQKIDLPKEEKKNDD